MAVLGPGRPAEALRSPQVESGPGAPLYRGLVNGPLSILGQTGGRNRGPRVFFRKIISAMSRRPGLRHNMGSMRKKRETVKRPDEKADKKVLVEQAGRDLEESLEGTPALDHLAELAGALKKAKRGKK
jgi:hypothetical protein